MSRLLAALAGQYLGAALAGMFVGALFFSSQWDMIGAVFYYIGPALVLIGSAIGIIMTRGLAPNPDRAPATRAGIGLLGAAIGALVAVTNAGAILLMGDQLFGVDDPDRYEAIAAISFLVATGGGAIVGYVTSR